VRHGCTDAPTTLTFRRCCLAANRCTRRIT
jgi:hypothetical protein